jgi:pyruvate dehydrogenase E2 component (dihydrolipoamide acetyltransferase)
MARRIIPIAMPKWGMEMVEGQIASWSKDEGETIAVGDDLLEIETDKVTNVYEAENGGVLRRRIGLEGTIYPVGALLAVVADADVPDEEIEGFIREFSGSDDAAAPPPAASAEAAAPTRAAGYDAPASAASAPETVDGERAGRLGAAAVEAQLAALKHEISPIAARVAVAEGIDLSQVTPTGRLGRISLADVEKSAGRPIGAKTQRLNVSPRARKLALEQGVDLSSVRGQGHGGRIHAADVLAAASAQAARAVRPLAGNVRVGAATSRSEANSAMRRTIARRLVQSKTTAPHIYLRTSIAMGEAVKLREGLNRRLANAKVSINDLLVRAAGLALVETPDVNVQYTDESMIYFDQADICVAIALPQGLVAPVVRGVDRKPVTQIAEEIRALAARARDGALGADDLSGGTFSVSNLGMFGIESFDAVINPPQAAILAAGAIIDRAVRVDGRIDLQPSMSVTLSCDHRAIDGAAGARYLAALKDLLENPVSLVM